jgi:subtilisin-like proprotein convertase family protein
VDIILTGTLTYTGVFVVQGCPTSGGTCVANNTNAAGNPALTGVALTAGVQYYIIVDTWPAPACTPFTINVQAAAPPPPPPPAPVNDLVCNATEISCGQTLAGTTIGATLAGTGEAVPCGAITPTAPGVWYVVPGGGQIMTASLCGTAAWDSYIQIYSGANCNSLNCVDGVDDAGPACAGLAASVSWNAQLGLNYYIFVSGFSTNSNFNLALSCVTPPPAIVGCTGSFTDSGGAAGNYGPNETQIFTYCPSAVGGRVRMTFTQFNLQNNFDFLTIYDGASTSAPTLGTYTGLVGPGVVEATLTNGSGCLTFVFQSDDITQNAGWSANISCLQPCQTIVSNLISTSPAVQGDGVIRICQGQQVTFNGSGTFSQSGAGASYNWSFGDGVPVNGSSVTQTFATAGSYIANLNIEDVNGCLNTNRLNVIIQVSTTPVISPIITPNPICLGQSAAASSTVNMTPFVQNCTPPISGTTFLPDGSGVSYQTSIAVDCYTSNQVVTTASDIQNICLNLEHSYLGDLNLAIVCPNGQSAILKSYPGGAGTYLGCPLDDPAVGPGTGAQYCFNSTATTLLVNAPNAPANCGTPAGITKLPGTYQPVQPFTNLIGCPLNGQWTIQVTDNLGADNGYIFNWDINFNPALLPPTSLTSFTPTIVSQGWQATSGLTTTAGSTSATVTPTVAGNNCYTYSVTDNFGCTYNQQACVSVISNLTAAVNSASICSGGSATITATPSIPGTYNYVWTVPSGAANPGNVASFNATVAGTYSVVVSTITTPSCSSPPAVGTLTVGATMTANSAAPNATVCLNQPLNPNIVFTTTGATGIGTINLPAGLAATFTGNATAGSITISGTPTSAAGSPFSYNVALTGGCGTVSAAGTLTISALPTVTSNLPSYSTCAGPDAANASAPGITLSSPQAGTTFNWSLYAGTVVAGVPIQTGTGNPNYAFTNSSCTDLNFVYQVVPVGSNGCQGNPLILPVLVRPKPTSTFSVSANPVCSNQIVTVTYTGTACPGATYNWTWPSGVTVVSGSGAGPYTISFGSISAPVNYVLRLQVVGPASLGSCTSTQTPINLVVNPTPTATIAGPTSVCSGNATALNLTSTPAGATFNWTQTATNASGSSNGTGTSINQTLTNTGAVNGTVQYVVTPVLNGCTGATSNTTVSVLQLPTATLLSSNNVCPGTSNAIIIQGTPGAQVTVVNGANNNTITIPPGGQISLSPNFYSWTTWPNGMNLVFTQVATTSAPICTTPLNFAVTANPTASASISIALTAGSNPSCAGSSLTFTATAINGGTAPQYQWAVNGVPAGTNSPTFTSSSLTNGQVVTCTLTSNATCLTSNVAVSNQIVVTINPLTLPAFNPIAQLCYGAAPIPALPSSSLNGITGIWSPTVISNTASGNYIFTPNPNQCASPTNLNVTVAPQVVLDGIYHD